MISASFRLEDAPENAEKRPIWGPGKSKCDIFDLGPVGPLADPPSRRYCPPGSGTWPNGS